MKGKSSSQGYYKRKNCNVRLTIFFLLTYKEVSIILATHLLADVSNKNAWANVSSVLTNSPVA